MARQQGGLVCFSSAFTHHGTLCLHGILNLGKHGVNSSYAWTNKITWLTAAVSAIMILYRRLATPILDLEAHQQPRALNCLVNYIGNGVLSAWWICDELPSDVVGVVVVWWW